MAANPTEQTTDVGFTEVVTRDGKNLAAVTLGRKGGLRGGPARAASLSAERKSQIARNAALRRWNPHGTSNDG